MIKKKKYSKVDEYCKDYFKEIEVSYDNQAKKICQKLLDYYIKSIREKIIYSFVNNNIINK